MGESIHQLVAMWKENIRACFFDVVVVLYCLKIARKKLSKPLKEHFWNLNSYFRVFFSELLCFIAAVYIKGTVFKKIEYIRRKISFTKIASVILIFK